MKQTSDEHMNRDDPVEALLGQAKPRPAPPAEDAAEVRAAVHAEWRAVAAGHRRRARVRQFGVAASLLVAVSLLLASLLSNDIDPVPVASIDKSHGTIYLLGDRSKRVELAGTATIHSGQVIETGASSGLGLEWGGGGSLRIDADTRTEFVDAESVFLHRGRVYFDSGMAGDDAQLVIDTDNGSVRHVGTQYMIATDGDRLVVSVREGSVEINGQYHDRTAVAGKQVELRGSAQPTVADLPGHSGAWTWIETMSPNIDLDDRSAHDFLRWVGRETGHAVVFASPEAERVARVTTLVGAVEADPRTELRLRMMTTDLMHEFDPVEGTIKVDLVRSDRP